MLNKLVVVIAALSSFQALAIENGTPVDWQNDFDDFVSGNCTGLVIGGDQILTAAHCGITGNYVVGNDGAEITVNSKTDHPNYTGFSNYDVSVLEVDKQKTENINFFADLNIATGVTGDSITGYGFGGSPSTLKKGHFTIGIASSSADDRLYHGFAEGSVKAVHGDSGGAWFNSANNIIAITYGDAGHSVYKGAISDLFYSRDFILEQIDGWHYPTVLNGSGTQTVKVQSLHQNSVVDAAYVAGDVVITGGTCQSLATINAFDTCTYELDVNGTGQLHLTSNEVIDINPPEAPVTPPVTTPSSGGSGGSLGFLSLFGLLVWGRFRCEK